MNLPDLRKTAAYLYWFFLLNSNKSSWSLDFFL